MCVSACFLWHWGKQPHARGGGGCTENMVQYTKYLIWKINGYALGLHTNWVSVSKIPIRLYSHCPPIQITAKHESRRLQTDPLRVSKQAWAKTHSWEKQNFQNFHICYLKKNSFYSLKCFSIAPCSVMPTADSYNWCLLSPDCRFFSWASFSLVVCSVVWVPSHLYVYPFIMSIRHIA